MNKLELEAQFRATITNKHRSWGRLISVLKRQFSAWISDILEKNGYEDFKMAYMPLLMNIGPDGITNKALSEKAFISKQAMSKVVKELLEHGYIETEKDYGDKRCANIFLTAKGKKLAITVREKIDDLENEYYSKFGSTKMDEVKDVLLDIINFNNATLF
jgi:DNA-binding MarR family transcriptional regulator